MNLWVVGLCGAYDKRVLCGQGNRGSDGMRMMMVECYEGLFFLLAPRNFIFRPPPPLEAVGIMFLGCLCPSLCACECACVPACCVIVSV